MLENVVYLVQLLTEQKNCWVLVEIFLQYVCCVSVFCSLSFQKTSQVTLSKHGANRKRQIETFFESFDPATDPLQDMRSKIVTALLQTKNNRDEEE